jgi:hypothetical protein
VGSEHAATLEELKREFAGTLSLPSDEDIPDLLARRVRRDRLAFAHHAKALGCTQCADVLRQIETVSSDEEFDRLHKRLAEHLFAEDDAHIDRLLAEKGF